MTTARLTAVIVLIAGLLSTQAQTGQLPSPQGVSVDGTVVDAASGGPIAGAMVRATITAPAGTTPPAPQTVQTNEDGHFAFAQLLAGRLTLTASATGYVSAAYTPTNPSNAPIPSDGRQLTGITIRLSAAGVISGTVKDERGTVMANVGVQVFRRSIQTTRRVWDPVRKPFTTDQNGMYRATDLPPGEYIVSVPVLSTTIPAAVFAAVRGLSQADLNTSPIVRSLRDSRGPLPSANVRPSDGSHTTVRIGADGAIFPDGDSRTTFYPHALTMNDAGVVTLAGGTEVTAIDVSIAKGASHNISGVLHDGGEPARFVGVYLIAGQADEQSIDYHGAVGVTETEDAGAYKFQSIPDGDYVIKVVETPAPPGQDNAIMPRADRLKAWAVRPISVRGADVIVPDMSLSAPLTISGRVVFGGVGAMQANQIPLSFSLGPVDGGMVASPFIVKPNPDGRFALRGEMAGRYHLWGGTAEGWMVESIVAEGRDVTAAPIVLTDHDVTDVVVTMTSRVTKVDGQVLDASGGVISNARVVIFPQDFLTWIENRMSIRVMRNTRSTPTGTYGISGLPAGEYLIAAFPDGDIALWPDRRTVEAAAMVAKRITLEEGRPLSMNLELNRVRQP